MLGLVLRTPRLLEQLYREWRRHDTISWDGSQSAVILSLLRRWTAHAQRSSVTALYCCAASSRGCCHYRYSSCQLFCSVPAVDGVKQNCRFYVTFNDQNRVWVWAHVGEKVCSSLRPVSKCRPSKSSVVCFYKPNKEATYFSFPTHSLKRCYKDWCRTNWIIYSSCWKR